MTSSNTLDQLLDTLPQIGTVKWIGIRPARRSPVNSVDLVNATTEAGLEGDRYAGRSGKRQVTLIQWEHLSVIAANLNIECVQPEALRRNIAISGINLLALKGKRFQVGSTMLEHTGLCHPCSFMEETFGLGGYNAVRGHGGITAKVIRPGIIRVGDTASVCR